ncbi:hypothetical protein EI982_13770 [Haloplanus rallus]|jgi:hypothetical protein|uniref:Uncharacterized protein n=1 Tax=Haloplanus rallus TaxID=1816183 RepID=A0A6B9FAM7_9EURY|nr:MULTISPECIES: hypothetical protein [Haloplanus]QGX95777.1 hypothetical protein EI982_13770 [Haloplanus rallus]
MPSTTRRRTLHGVATLLAGVGLAGCSGESSSTSTHPAEATGNVAFDPESYSLRNADLEPILWSGDRPTTEPGTDDDARIRHLADHRFVADADDAAAVSIADVDGAAGAREFLDSTDYDAATVYVEQIGIRECFTQELCHVRWSETEVDTDYARHYRDADVACETDARDVLVTLIRIPEAFDPGGVNSYGSSRGSGTCERSNEHLRRRRNRSDDGGAR